MSRSYRLLFGLGILLAVSAITLVASPTALPLLTADPVGLGFRLLDVSPAFDPVANAAVPAIIEGASRSLSFAFVVAPALMVLFLFLFALHTITRSEVRARRIGVAGSAV